MATVADRPQGSPQRPQAPWSRRVIIADQRAARLLASIAVALAIAAAVLAIVLGSGPAPPATGAATVVPASALLYVSVSTDRARPEVKQAISRLQRLSGAPLLLAAVTERLDAILAGSRATTVDFASDVRPWLGREAALAVLDTPGTSAGTLIVLDVSDRARAQAFLSGQGAIPDGRYRKIALMRERSGTTLAFLGHYLVLGQRASVDAAIDVTAGRALALSGSSAYGEATAAEPADRVVGFYAPAAGVRRALLPSQGMMGALGVLLDQPALRAATVSVSPSAGGLAIRVHTLLDPKRASAPAPAFTPSLAGVLPAGSTMVLDVHSLPRSVPKLLAAAAKLGIAARAAELLSRLGGALRAQGVNPHRFFSIFGSESALAIVPGVTGAPAPVLVGRTGHPAGAVAELSSLEAPLTQAFTPPSGGGGMVPEVAAVTLGKATVSELTLAPGFQLDWAVSRGLVVVSTSPGAVAAVISHHASLGAGSSYAKAVAGFPSQVTTLVFLDLGPLLDLGSRFGLIAGKMFSALRPDLEQIRAIGLATTRGESDTTTQLQLQIR